MCTLPLLLPKSSTVVNSLLTRSNTRRFGLISRRYIQLSIRCGEASAFQHNGGIDCSRRRTSSHSSASRQEAAVAATAAAITSTTTNILPVRQQHSKSSLLVTEDISRLGGFFKFGQTSPAVTNLVKSKTYTLPKQPLPDISSSLTRYLNSLRPVLVGDQNDEDKLRYTESCVRKFLNSSECHSLQAILYDRAMSRDNWALEKNLDQYLMDTRNCLPIHASPAKVMKRQHFDSNENAYLTYVTLLVKAIYDFKSKIDDNTLETDRCNAYEKGQPMCMEQYKNIFSSYREPGTYRDCFRVYNDDLENQFIVVMSRGQLFKVNVIVDSRFVSDLELFQQFKEIRRASLSYIDPRQEVGYLTTLPRYEWATIRQHLLKNPINRKSMETIEKCSFMICLDEKVESNGYENECVKNGLQLLHGSGIELNSRNRWYDKTLQFVISEDGVNGLIREHSPSEGPITVNLINHVYKSLKSAQFFDSYETYPFSEPERLEWSLSDDLAEKIDEARLRHDYAIRNFDMTVFKYEKFGRTYPKLFSMSPDSFLQVIYQLAYFRMYGKLPVQASIASQRRFFKGRADYIRSPTIDSLNFCLSMDSNQASMSERFYLFEKAVETQTRIMVDTILGNGFDCHLFSLKKIATELDVDSLPAIFKDPSFEFNSQFQLLTSQVTTTDDGTFSCFSPTSQIGYGSSYNLKPDHIVFMMSTYKSCSYNSINCLAHSLIESLDHVFEMCQHRFKSMQSNERRMK